ncbi:MAG: hypothetical protein ACOY3L_06735 [Pseudomonadota bacterium]
MRRFALALALIGTGFGSSGAMAASDSDYPTEALADYVFACMASNGETQEVLRRCSCSIDVVSSIIPYDKYVQAETILSMSQVPGENTGIFRDPSWVKGVVADLRRAQAEAEVRCF